MKESLYAVLFVSFILALPLTTQGQSLSQKSGNVNNRSVQKTHNKSNKAAHSSRTNSQKNLFNKHNEFHNKYYKSHDVYTGGKDYYYGPDKHNVKKENKHHSEKHYKRYKKDYYYGYNDPYYYDPYIYYGGFNNEPYPYYGYDTTLGSYPQRPNNVEVNRYLNEFYGRDAYPEQDNYNAEPGYEQDSKYSYEPYTEQEAIYIFIDENGVEHFVNDIDLVPLEYLEDMRVINQY